MISLQLRAKKRGGIYSGGEKPDKKSVDGSEELEKESLDTSYRCRVAETVLLSSLLESMKVENESNVNDSEQSKPAGVVAVSPLQDTEDLMVGTMAEIFNSIGTLAAQNVVENATLVDHFGDRGTYTGELCNGEPDGYGLMLYDDNRRYEGTWIHGRYHGKGQTSFANGDSYTGEYKSDHMHGSGTYYWEDGRYYVGKFCEDQRQGHGVYSWPDGSKYTGYFSGGKMHGSGTHGYKCGSTYEGEFQQGQYHGYGCLTHANGRSYEGNFRLGHTHGLGKEFYPDGSLGHDGLWNKGEPSGERPPTR